MSARRTRRAHALTALGALAAGFGLAVAGAAPVAAAGLSAAGDSQSLDIHVTVPGLASGPFTVEDAQLRWGLNEETGSAAFAGGCNFLSAGAVGDTGGGKFWTAQDGFYRAASGAVTIEKPYRSGGSTQYRSVPFADRCLDLDGRAVTTGSMLGTGVQAVVDGGTGAVDPDTGTAEIRWRGSFTVVTYGGLAYWWVTDPVLTLTGGQGRVRATVSGYATSREDLSKWERITPQEVTLAELTGVSLGADKGFAVVPRYRGVRVELPSADTPQVRTGPDWGSFPQSFVDFHRVTGQASYWYSSGGARDGAKPATTLYVSYDAAAAVPPAPPATGGGGSGGGSVPVNPVNPFRPAPAAPGTAGTVPPPAETPDFPATVAQTLLPLARPLVPGLGVLTGSGGGEAALGFAAAGLLFGAAGAVVGFRRGWLVWPWA